MQKNYVNPVGVVIGGGIILAIVMSIGRFAYTPLLPLMQEATSFSTAFAGYLASINYLGYLLGALGAGLIAWKGRKTSYLRLNLILNIATTLAMGFTENYLLWLLFRFISGLTSGLVFVLASSIVLDILAKKEKTAWVGLFYSGVGLGIFFSGILIPLFNAYLGWQGTWISLGILAIGLAIVSWHKVVEDNENIKEPTTQYDKGYTSRNDKKGLDQSVPLPHLILAYGLQGLGYIISGTFLVAIISEQAIAFSNFPSLVWALVGLAAAPSCLIWALIAKKWGSIHTLGVAYFLQAIGIVMPILLPNIFGAIIGGLLFGGTFMGIVTLALPMARNMYPEKSSKVIGYMTFAYAIGQTLGPIIAGILTTNTGNYNLALIFASVTVLAGVLTLLIGKTEKKDHLEKAIFSQ